MENKEGKMEQKETKEKKGLKYQRNISVRHYEILSIHYVENFQYKFKISMENV